MSGNKICSRNEPEMFSPADLSARQKVACWCFRVVVPVVFTGLGAADQQWEQQTGGGPRVVLPGLATKKPVCAVLAQFRMVTHLYQGGAALGLGAGQLGVRQSAGGGESSRVSSVFLPTQFAIDVVSFCFRTFLLLSRATPFPFPL